MKTLRNSDALASERVDSVPSIPTSTKEKQLHIGAWMTIRFFAEETPNAGMKMICFYPP